MEESLKDYLLVEGMAAPLLLQRFGVALLGGMLGAMVLILVLPFVIAPSDTNQGRILGGMILGIPIGAVVGAVVLLALFERGRRRASRPKDGK